MGRGVDLYFPAAAGEYVERLQHCAAQMRRVEVREHPVESDGVVAVGAGFELQARALDHRIPAVGWRLQEPDGRRVVAAAAAARGVTGPAVGQLVRDGRLAVDGRVVTLEEVSEPRRGQSFAFVMDTRLCPGAHELARGVDMLVAESTFLDRDADLADTYAHLTARQAAQIAADGGARRLVLTHFSGRYRDVADFAAEAAPVFADVHAGRDLDRVPLPPR